jgi:hypothetical protein
VGTDSFTYKDFDGTLYSSPATVTITVTNTPPVAVDDTAQGTKKTTLTINVLANDYDADGDPLTIIAAGTPTARRATVTTDGKSVYYAAPPGFRGTDSFTYTISDPYGATAQAKVTVTIN